jgi:SPP1 family phage portal protein
MGLTLQRTTKTILSSEDILKYISDYEVKVVPELDKLWEYYKGKNVKITKRKMIDPNNPDNRIIVSYARKIVNTWTGYGARPHYITYKANIKEVDKPKENAEEIKVVENPLEKQYLDELSVIFRTNNEPIKTNRAWRNIAIFGASYELTYIDFVNTPMDKELPIKSMPKFFTVDPREMILLYDYSPEPKIVCGIRYYKMDSDSKYKVEVYYSDHIDTYIRERKEENSTVWVLTVEQLGITNYFNTVPIVAFYNGDEMQSIFENILSLIDAFDTLYSDSMNEFDRFAFAYLVMKKFGLTNPTDKKDPTKSNENLKNIKRRRVFEHLDKDAEISFLTKDIPTQFIQWMNIALREQIHIQSHVPDFSGDKMAGASGIAIQRLMFDFENLVSSVEADFDIGLYHRITLIAGVLKKLNRPNGTNDMIIISHKRNVPLNTQEFAQTAMTMATAGFSRRAIVGVMPEDIIPDIEKELEEERKEREEMVGQYNLEAPIEDEEILEENVEEENV